MRQHYPDSHIPVVVSGRDFSFVRRQGAVVANGQLSSGDSESTDGSGQWNARQTNPCRRTPSIGGGFHSGSG